MLTGEVKARVHELEKRITELRDQGEFEEAIKLADQALTLRREHQSNWTNAEGEPAEWYEIGDARRAIEDLRLVASLTPEQRAELEEADQLEAEEEGLYQRGRYAEAAELMRRQLETRRRVLDHDHPDTLVSINNMGFLLKALGKPAEAEPYYRQALEGRRHVLGDDHPETAISINNMGVLLQAQGKLADAEPYLREALERKHRLLGDDHPGTLNPMHNMGVLLQAQGKLAEAEAYLREALEGSRRVLGDDHPFTLTAISNMGLLRKTQGKLPEAEPYFRQALEGRRRVLGDDHPSTLTSINNMGFLLESMGKLPEAEPYYREALEGCRRVQGDDHPDTLSVIGNMATLLQSMGKLREAEPYHREALEGRRCVLGDDHPNTLASISNVGALLKSMGELAEAEPYYRQALEGLRRVLGDDHPETAISINNMGVLLQAQGKLADAEPYLREALERKRRVLGNDHPDTLGPIDNMGILLQAQGKPGAAEPFFNEAMALAERLRTQVIGRERSRAVYAGKLGLSGIAARLASLLIETGRSAEAWSVTERGRGRALLDLLFRSDWDVIEQARIRAERAGDSKAFAKLEAALSGEQQAKADLTTAEALLAGKRKQREHTDKRDDLRDDDKSARLAKIDQQIAEQHKAVRAKRTALGNAVATVSIHLRGLFPDAKPMAIEQIRTGLKPGELAVGYTWTPEFVLLLLAEGTKPGAPEDGNGNDGVAGLVLAKGKEQVADLTKLVRRERDSIAAKPSSATVAPDRKAIGRLLARLVPDPVRQRIESASRLIILPDGPLHGVPFEALAAANDGPGSVPGLADCQIVYAASATMYLNRRTLARQAPRSPVPSAVVLGDPILDRDPVPEPDYPKGGVLLAKVEPDSNAAKAGLTRGDVLLSYGGKDLPNTDALGPAIAAVNEAVKAGEREADEPVKVAFWRKGKTRETRLAPGRMGVHRSPGNAVEGLRSLARLERGFENGAAEISATDQVRLFGRRLRPLPGTAREARAIASLFARANAEPPKSSPPAAEKTAGNTRNVALLLGEDATIAKLSASVGGKRFVHLATHGLTGNAERPYDASLALTQPESVTPDDIGFLRLDDLIRTWRGKLKDCEMVVLSACDTQRGVRKGTGIMSLPWGFMYAGAPTVVASLWKVDDRATMLLMTRFYENVLGLQQETRGIGGREYGPGQPMAKVDALGEAKRWLRSLTPDEIRKHAPDERDTRLANQPRDERGITDVGRTVKPTTPSKLATVRPYAHPYYWAAFILMGDPE